MQNMGHEARNQVQILTLQILKQTTLLPHLVLLHAEITY